MPHAEMGEGFAVLTGLLEDAAGLAAEGQSPRLARGEAQALVADLRDLLGHATAALDELDATLAGG